MGAPLAATIDPVVPCHDPRFCRSRPSPAWGEATAISPTRGTPLAFGARGEGGRRAAAQRRTTPLPCLFCHRRCRVSPRLAPIRPNHLSGLIPTELGALASMQMPLYLSRSSLIGPIPSELGRLTAMTSFMQLNGNQLCDDLPHKPK